MSALRHAPRKLSIGHSSAGDRGVSHKGFIHKSLGLITYPPYLPHLWDFTLITSWNPLNMVFYEISPFNFSPGRHNSFWLKWDFSSWFLIFKLGWLRVSTELEGNMSTVPWGYTNNVNEIQHTCADWQAIWGLQWIFYGILWHSLLYKKKSMLNVEVPIVGRASSQAASADGSWTGFKSRLLK